VKELPDRFNELGEFIREQRNSARLSLRRLSELAGISNPYLSQIERGLRRPSAEILQQIAKALRISAETLYVRAGILDDHSAEHSDLIAHIRAATDIDEYQKQVLIAAYLSFRAQREQGPADERFGGAGAEDAGTIATTATPAETVAEGSASEAAPADAVG
jgi:transcriptional regulator with XRE-family HTH domain